MLSRLICFSVTLLSLSIAANTQTSTQANIIQPPDLNADYSYNYKQIKNVEPDVKTLTTDLFGDKIDLASGGLRFSQTDVSIPGNFALDVAFTRTMSGPESWFRETQELGNWSIDLPHVRSNYVAWPDGTPHGNFTSTADGKTAYWPDGRACSPKLNSNPDFERNEFAEDRPAIKYYQDAPDYWNGDKVYIPGKGSTTLLNREADATYKRYNNKQWDVECWDDPLKPNQEGFKITTLDGTSYYFSEQVIRRNGQKLNLIRLATDTDCKPGQDCNITIDLPSDSERLKIDQYVIFLLVTKIEDKFGNRVEYHYNEGKLSRIESSDNRIITIDYLNNKVDKVTANGRQWDYDYDEHGALSRIDLSNGQHWAFNNGGDLHGTWREWFPPHLYVGEGCIATTTLPRHFITITHPYGMQGEFNVDAHCFGQVNVPRIEQANPGGNTDRQTHWLKTENRTIVLDNKTLTFPDGSQYVWDYQYSTNPGLFDDETANSEHHIAFKGTARADIKTTTVLHPNNDKTIHYFDRTYGLTENNLLATETYSAGSKLLQRQRYDYSYSESYGTNRTQVNITYARNEFVKQKKSWNDESAVRTDKLTTELFDGAAITIGATGNAIGLYEQQITAYNHYNQPLTAEASHNSNTRHFKFGYLDDASHGVYNLPTTIQVSDSAIADSATGMVKETTYQPLSDSQSVKVPNEIRAFGLWKQRFTEYHTENAGSATSANVNNAIGQPKKVEFNAALATGSGNRFVEYVNYKRGQPTQIRVPARYAAPGDNGVNTQSAYQTIDNNGWVTRVQDFNGTQTHYGYDDEGRLHYIDNPVMNGTQSDLDNTGQWLDHVFTWSETTNGSPQRKTERCVASVNAQTNVASCDAAAFFTETQHFDSLLRPTLTHRTNSTGATTRIHRYQVNEYDHYNNATFTSYWSASSALSQNTSAGTTRTFDALSRLRSEAVTAGGANLSTVLTDYLSNNRMRVTDARGNITTTTYRAFGSPAYELATEIVSPEDVTTSLSYNAFDRITAITQSGKNAQDAAISITEHRAYNAWQQLCKTRRPDTGQTVFVNNALGQVTEKQEGTTGGTHSDCVYTHNAQAVMDFGFDNLGDNRSVTFHDNQSGTASPNLQYTLDANSNLTQLRSSIASDVVTQDYRYNNLNLLEQETLILDGKTLTLDYQYDALGSVSTLTYPEGDAVSFAPNAFGEATQVVRSPRAGENAGENTAFTYASNATYHPSGSIHTFTYGNGLTHETKLNSRLLPESIKDATPANVASPVTALHYSYQYDNNQNVTRLTDHLDASFSLNALTYDGLNRLTSTTAAQSDSLIGNTTLTYDGLGNITRYAVTSGNNTAQDLRYTYNYSANLTSYPDGSVNRLRSIDDQGSRNRDYLLFEYDNRGSITNNSFNQFTYNRANQMVSAVSASTSSELDDIGYTGHKFDQDIGLSYMQARYYDPVIGRFLSNDPVDTLGHLEKGNPVHGFGRYTYANNNPYKYVDPDGEFAFLAPLVPPAAAALGKAAAFVGTAAAAGYAGSEAINAFNESAAPDLPEGLVGDQSDDRAGQSRGKRHNSGSLTPGNGGTGNPEEDFEKLTGGTGKPAEGRKEGTRIGDNGVTIRPGKEGEGPRIDIPANGEKPPETLHYEK